jgi:hypothetical protein
MKLSYASALGTWHLSEYRPNGERRSSLRLPARFAWQLALATDCLDFEDDKKIVAVLRLADWK